jgi:MFS family permease
MVKIVTSRSKITFPSMRQGWDRPGGKTDVLEIAVNISYSHNQSATLFTTARCLILGPPRLRRLARQPKSEPFSRFTCLAAFLFFNSFGSIGVALPAMQKQFANSLSEIQWISLMGVVTISCLSFCFGRLGGSFGQRRLYKVGVSLYAVGAGLGGISTSFLQLLGARAVMALGLAMALPMSTAILATSFAPERRGRVLGLFASAIVIGRMTGPAVGGFLLYLGGWPWIFWMNFAVGAVVTPAVLKIFHGPGEIRREVFDTWGAAALLVGYPALLIGLTFGSSHGGLSVPVIGAFAVASLGLLSFVWIELPAAKPLIDGVIFKDGLLAAALITVVLRHLINHPIALVAPLYLQNVLGAAAITSGLLLAILPLSTALVAD